MQPRKAQVPRPQPMAGASAESPPRDTGRAPTHPQRLLPNSSTLHGPDDGVAPELLGYLFEEPPADIGRRVGDALVESRLAGMGDAGVRAMLARKLCRLLPDLPPDGRDKVTTVALRALEELARDHVTHVREALATAVKDIACAPPAVVKKLARDVERSVAEPVLHYCATLTDADLLAIIANQPTSWALSAIARRHQVSAPVSSAIVDAGDTQASGVLLDNNGAVIPEDTLEKLVEDAAENRDWQAKLAHRPALPRRLAVRLADFVDSSVVEVLRTRPDFDDATVAEIAAATRRRVDWIEACAPGETPERRAVRLHRQGTLDETAIGDALSWNEVGFVRAALALRSAVRPVLVDEILASLDARAVTALVWRAGFSMRCAMQVQARAAGIPPRAMLNAREGTAFPLTPSDMARHLARYGVRA
ncbi:DUF2336 domain-containing protein [Azospirillum soli]|uniref:DUF2336 domain-containing protein n=1 Tax=Azospirillum soli TaxID=1304799 RepID=UPI001FE99C0A|nr:DUF2336 domain-containing protein [Azospirillum soli]MBP2313406.1 uncharacterized protein (DUF2336 family) [Azospirillum soli]